MSNIFFVFFFVVFNVSSLLKERLSPEELRELTNVVAAEIRAEARVEAEAAAKAVVAAEVEKKTRAVVAAEVEKKTRAVVAAEVERKTRAEVEKANQEWRLKVNGLEKELEELKKSPGLSPQPAPKRKKVCLEDLRFPRSFIIDPSTITKLITPHNVEDFEEILRRLKEDRLFSKAEEDVDMYYNDLERRDYAVLQNNVKVLGDYLEFYKKEAPLDKDFPEKEERRRRRRLHEDPSLADFLAL